MNKKLTGIVSYITIVGWIIAYLAGDKEGAKFHLNQSLIINLASLINGWILGAILGIIPFIGPIVSLILSILIFTGNDKGAFIILMIDQMNAISIVK